MDFLYDWDKEDTQRYLEENEEADYEEMHDQEPKDERINRLSVMKTRYRRQYFKELFDGVTPVFVGATINRAVTTVIGAMIGNNTSDAIAINFVYSLFVAHGISYLIAVKVPSTWNLFPYVFRLSIENAGFAWLSTLTLIILKWMYQDKNPGLAFVAWVVLVVLVLILIILFGFIEYKYLKPTPTISKKLRIFMSDVRNL